MQTSASGSVCGRVAIAGRGEWFAAKWWVLGVVLATLTGCSSAPDDTDQGASRDVAVGTVAAALHDEPGKCTSSTFGGHIYYFCTNAQSWTAARAACLAKPGLDLLKIDSAAENAFVAPKIASLSAWTAADDRTTEGNWRWSTGGSDDGPQFWSGTFLGSPVGGLYSNWDLGEPVDPLGDCGSIRSSGKWADDLCSLPLAYVCEGDACPSDPNKLEPGVCGCGVADTDSDGDGRADCFDLCPHDPFRTAPGDCGCSDAPKPQGSSCGDGLCSTNNQCDGAGTCGAPAACAPNASCTFQRYAAEGGRGYFICPGPVTWTAAKAQCEAKRGMSLARIDSAAENAFIQSKLSSPVWFGADDRTVEGIWQWSQTAGDVGDSFWTGFAAPLGTSVNGLFSQWKAGQPDNAGEADCGRMDPANGGAWDDASCTSTAGYVCEISPDPCAGLQVGSPWPALERCASREARSAVIGAQTSDLNWTVAVNGTTGVGSPVVGSDESVFVASGTKLASITSSGAIRWTFTAGDVIDSAPAISNDGSVYVESADGHLYGITQSGSKHLDAVLLHPAHSAPVVGADGTLYVAAGDDIAALNADGTTRWSADVGDASGLSPSLGTAGTVYIGSRFPSGVFAFTSGGSKLWFYSTLAAVQTTVVVGRDGTLYAGAGSSLFALTPAGALKWKYAAGSAVRSSPAIGADGTLYFGSDSGTVHAVNPTTGAAVWKRVLGGAVSSSPAVDGSGNVYLGSADHNVYALKQSDGSILFSAPTGAAVTASPALGTNGTVYVGSADGKLYSVGGGPEPVLHCVTRLGPTRFGAVFGYRSQVAATHTIPRGPQNLLNPPPSASPPGIQPVDTFHGGVVDRAFTAFFDAGGTESWVLRGRTATATAASPQCAVDDYPKTQDLPRIDPEHASSPGAHAIQVAADFLPPQSLAPLANRGIGVVQQPLTLPQGNFTIQLTSLSPGSDLGLGFCDSPDFEAELKIDAQSCGHSQIAGGNICDKCAFIGCCGACGVSGTVSVSKSCTEPVGVSAPTVDVEIFLFEDDNLSSNENLADGHLTIDNSTGEVLSATGGHMEGPNTYVDDRSGWAFGFTITPAGPPKLATAPKVCGKWNASFVDELGADDHPGEVVPGKDFKHYPARYAEYALDVQNPLGTAHWGANYDASGSYINGTILFLDDQGCLSDFDLAHPTSLTPNDPTTPVDPKELFVFLQSGGSDPNSGGLKFEMRLKSELGRFDSNDLIEYQVERVTSGLTIQGNFDVSKKTAEFESQVVRSSDGSLPLGDWTSSGAWSVPPATITVAHPTWHTDVTRASAAMGQLMASEDTPGGAKVAIVPGTYVVFANDGCNATGLEHDACYDPTSKVLFIGPGPEPPTPTSCTATADCPKNQFCDQSNQCAWLASSFWKYVLTHEAGHQVQDRAVGTLGGTASYLFDCCLQKDAAGNCVQPEPSLCQGQPRLCADGKSHVTCPEDHQIACTTSAQCSPGKVCSGGFCAAQVPTLLDPFGVDPRCRCDTVEAANGRHCLNSVERGGAAQGEGFAQFFSSKVWNTPDESACSFVYYKEFPLEQCPPGNDCTVLPAGYGSFTVSARPPIAVSCKNAYEWRNHYCGMNQFADFGTELDWMGFLWSTHTASGDRLASGEIFKVYRVACSGNAANATPCAGSGIGYEPLYQHDANGAIVLDSNGVGVLQFELCSPRFPGCDAQGRALDGSGQLVAVRGGVRDGAVRVYGVTSPKYNHVVTSGRQYGVDTNIVP